MVDKIVKIMKEDSEFKRKYQLRIKKLEKYLNIMV